jgi:hypothetical protein
MSLCYPSPAQPSPLGTLVLNLWDAVRTPSEPEKKPRRRTSGRPRYNCTLRPGTDTPLWNELVNIATPLLRKRGTKAHLARILDLPRQRLNTFFVRHSATPDAERTLLLLVWIAQRQRGKDLG